MYINIDSSANNPYWLDSSGGCMLVYQIKNKINGKSYIGATTRTMTRRYSDNWCARLLSNKELRGDVLKYGQKSFKLIILKRPKTIETMFKWEKQFIKSLNTLFPNGYNFQSGGDRGIKVHEETKRKISHTMINGYVHNRGVFSKRKTFPCMACGAPVSSCKTRGEYKKTCSKECFKKHMSIKCKGYTNNKKGINQFTKSRGI